MVGTGLSPQSQRIYTLLLREKPMTAVEIGEQLRTFPHAVYRSVKPLIQTGCVTEIDRYPKRFRARPWTDARDTFLSSQRDLFEKTFRIYGKRTNSEEEALHVAFIQRRKDSFLRFTEDIKQAKTSIDLLVSGLEAPAESILGLKRAIERRVRVRAIVQEVGAQNSEMIRNWQKMGINVRSTAMLLARLLLIDQRIAYLLSYDSKEPERAVGIRFLYPPIARIMVELFEQKWRSAPSI